MKAVGGFRRTRYRGVARTGLAGYLVATAYNLVRMANLTAALGVSGPLGPPAHRFRSPWGRTDGVPNLFFSSLLEVQTKRGCWEACPVLPGTLAGPVDVGLCSPVGIGSAVRDGRLRMLGAACKSPAQWGPDTGHHGPKQRASPLRWQPTDG